MAGRYSQSYSEALPDFVKLAEAYAVSACAPKPGANLTARLRK